MFQHTGAAVDEAIAATGVVKGSGAHHAFRTAAHRAIESLGWLAAENGCHREVEAAYFRLAADEPHRLPQLVTSVRQGRVRDVMNALLDY